MQIVQQIITQIQQIITPAAEKAYQVALVGSKMTALNNMMSDFSGLLSAIILLPMVPFLLAACIVGARKTDGEDGWTVVFAVAGVMALAAFVIGLAQLCSNLPDFIFQYTLFKNPPAAFAYQIMHKI